jgi:hypothetical protein
MRGLPADSPFRQTVKVSLLREIAELWWRASQSQRQAGLAPASFGLGTLPGQPVDKPSSVEDRKQVA